MLQFLRYSVRVRQVWKFPDLCKRLHISGKSIPQGSFFRNMRFLLPIASNCFQFRLYRLYVPVKPDSVPCGGRENRPETGSGPVRMWTGHRAPEGLRRRNGTGPFPPGRGKTTRYRRSGCPDAAGERGPPAAFCIPEQSNIEENSHSVYRVQGKYNKKSNKYKKIFKHVRTLFFAVVNVSGAIRRCQKRFGTQENTTYCACKKCKTGVYFPSLKKRD